MAASREITFTVPQAADERQAAVDKLRSQLSAIEGGAFAEVWVDLDPFPTLCGLLNDRQGWLLCLRFDGDAGVSSRNPRYTGADDAMAEFQLGNGQVDAYPASWCSPRQEILDALVSFAETGRLAATLSWCNDEDELLSPDDAMGGQASST